MLAFVLVGMATAAPTLKAPDDIFSLDLTWKPALPVGGHTYSGEFSVQEVFSPTHTRTHANDNSGWSCACVHGVARARMPELGAHDVTTAARHALQSSAERSWRAAPTGTLLLCGVVPLPHTRAPHTRSHLRRHARTHARSCGHQSDRTCVRDTAWQHIDCARARLRRGHWCTGGILGQG